ADDPGDVVAVAVEIAGTRETCETRRLLKMMHAVRHHLDAALNGGARLTETLGERDDTLHTAHQLALGRQGALGEPPRQLARQRYRRLGTADHRGKTLQVEAGLGGWQRRLVLDGVGNAA